MFYPAQQKAQHNKQPPPKSIPSLTLHIAPPKLKSCSKTTDSIANHETITERPPRPIGKLNSFSETFEDNSAQENSAKQRA